jgi:hypothetical protein
MLRADLFLALPKDAQGTVSLQDVADSLHAGCHRVDLWRQAAKYDADGDGMLSVKDFLDLLIDTASAYHLHALLDKVCLHRLMKRQMSSCDQGTFQCKSMGCCGSEPD